MILEIKLNKDTTIHDLQRLTKDFKDMYEIECSLSQHSYDIMRLIVNKQVSIHDIQDVIGTCGELYVDTDVFDTTMNKIFNPSYFGIDMTNGNSIFSQMIKDLNTKGINK